MLELSDRNFKITLLGNLVEMVNNVTKNLTEEIEYLNLKIIPDSPKRW